MPRHEPCVVWIRFTKPQLAKLGALLGFGAGTSWVLPGRNRLNGPTLVFLAMARFAQSAVSYLLHRTLGWPEETINKAQRFFVSKVIAVAKVLLCQVHPVVHSRERIKAYAKALHVKGNPLKQVFGFLDGVKVKVKQLWVQVGFMFRFMTCVRDTAVFSNHRHFVVLSHFTADCVS